MAPEIATSVYELDSGTVASGLHREISRHEIKTYGVLVVAAVLPYLTTLRNGFVWDDDVQLLENPYLRSFRYIGRILATHVWSFQSVASKTNYYRPLMSLQYLMMYHLFGAMAYPYHLVNVLMNLAVILLLFILVRRLSGSEPVALVTAVVFAIHPVHVEVVAWVAAIPDLQLTIFVLATFWFYLDMRDPLRKRWWTPFALCMFFTLAILAKEPAVMLPAILTVYELFIEPPQEAPRLKRGMQLLGPLWGITAIYLLARIHFMGALIPNISRSRMPWSQAILSAVSMLGGYFNLLVWPADLNVYRMFAKTTSVIDWHFAQGAAWLSLVGSISWILWRRNRQALLAVLWFFAFLAPTLNARWMPEVAISDRYLYLPSIGVAWLIAVALLALWSSRGMRNSILLKSLCIATGSVAAVLLIVRVAVRVEDWHDDLAVFKTAVRQNPDSAKLHINLGTAYWVVHEDRLAQEQWQIALKIEPQNAFALTNLGKYELYRKNFGRAAELIQQAISVKQNFSDAHAALAQVFIRMGKPVDAEREFKIAIEISPLELTVRNAFARFCDVQGRESNATREYRESLDVLPNNEAFDGLGDIALRHDETSAAEQDFMHAEDLDEYDHHAHYQLALIYAASGKTAEARREYDLGYKTDIGTDPLGPTAKDAIEHHPNR